MAPRASSPRSYSRSPPPAPGAPHSLAISMALAPLGMSAKEKPIASVLPSLAYVAQQKASRFTRLEQVSELPASFLKLNDALLSAYVTCYSWINLHPWVDAGAPSAFGHL